MPDISLPFRQAAAGAALVVLLLAGGGLPAGAQDSQYPQANDTAEDWSGSSSLPAGAYGMMTLLFVVGGTLGVFAIVAIGRHERHRQSERAAGRRQ